MSQSDRRIANLTPERLALLESRLRQQRVRPDDIAARRDGAADLPLSFAQQRLWFLDRLQPGSVHYNVPAAVRLSGSVDVTSLRRAIDAVVRRHEVLRTTFHDIDGEPRQTVASKANAELPVVDLRPLAPAARELEAQRVAASELQRTFDLARGPLFRATLLQIDAADFLLLLVMHHIVSDAWSMPILLGEIAAIYDAFVRGLESPLPPLPIQYGDFALWQRQWLRGEVLDGLLTYWKNALDGMPTVLDLPFDRSRPAMQSLHGATHTFVVPPPLAAALKALGQRHGATLFMTMLAAFAALLHRDTGQPDLAIGTPIANRSRTELQNLIGFFTNTLVIRSRSSDNPAFRDLLAQVRETTLGAYDHQDLPFEKLVEELQPERSLSHNPLFQVLFTLQAPPDSQSADASGDPAPLVGGTAKFDLSLFVSDTGQRLLGCFEYNTDLFDATTIERMAGRFDALLRQVAEHPDMRLSELPLLAPAERDRLLVGWNRTASDPDRPPCVHEVFERQADRTPDAVAVIVGASQVTYRALNERANQLAHTLRDRGVGPESRVAICLDRSVAMPAAVLGVLKAGAACVPLDPGDPTPRLDVVLGDARPAVVITLERLRGRFGDRPIVCVDPESQAIDRQPTHDPPHTAGRANLAYIIYTSGSTGQPKGVMMPHGPLANLVSWQLAQPHAGSLSLQFAPLGFDVAFQEMFSTWCAGRALLLVGDAERRDPDRLAAILEAHAVDRLFLPYVALNQLATLVTRPGALAVRTVVTAGEALHVTDRIAAFFATLPGSTLCNQYGPSETHVVSQFVLDGSPADWPLLPPIGRPIANTTLFVLDRWMQPVPIGVAGELYVGGRALARGYLDRPDLTAERFVPDPFSREAGARLYRTGDFVRYRADGNLEFLGRRDDQVKIRGYRVELAEVEAALRTHPRLTEAAVVAFDAPGGKRLAAYFVGDPDVGADELRYFIAARLPGYMVPSSFTHVDELPLTRSGKIDRGTIARRRHIVAGDADAYVPPRSGVEQALADIWKEVLGAERVGVRDNFFELGGHSLSATQVVSRVRTAFGIDVPLRTLFEAPTIEAFLQAMPIDAPPTRQELPPPPKPRVDLPQPEAVDELSDEDVDRLLQSLLEAAETIDEAVSASGMGSRPELDAPPIVPVSLPPDDIVSRVDDLTDEEVDRWLATLIGSDPARQGGANEH